MTARGRPVTIIRACLRDGSGGSPTAVLDDATLSDDERRRVPVLTGTSHAVFVSAHRGRSGDPTVFLRFFTAEGELPACGHGTIAALAYLAARAEGEQFRAILHAAGRAFAGAAVRHAAHFTAVFDPGRAELREPTTAEGDLVLTALGITPRLLAPGIRVAAVGRSRLLVPVASRPVLAALAPDLGRLREACDRHGFLGCFVYTTPTHTGRIAARMFAPSIGVPEDIANANSTACLAAHLAGQGISNITVDMGDALGSPATITAATRHSPSGPLIELGGTAELTRIVRLP